MRYAVASFKINTFLIVYGFILENTDFDFRRGDYLNARSMTFKNSRTIFDQANGLYLENSEFDDSALEILRPRPNNNIQVDRCSFKNWISSRQSIRFNQNTFPIYYNTSITNCDFQNLLPAIALEGSMSSNSRIYIGNNNFLQKPNSTNNEGQITSRFGGTNKNNIEIYNNSFRSGDNKGIYF